MNKVIIIFLLAFTVACTEKEPTASIEAPVPVLNVSMYDSPYIDVEVAMNNSYELSYGLEGQMDGYDATDKIRENVNAGELAILAMTADVMLGTKELSYSISLQ